MNRACAGQTVLDLFPAPPRDHVEDTLTWMCDVHGCIRGEIEGEVRELYRDFGTVEAFDRCKALVHFRDGKRCHEPLLCTTPRQFGVFDPGVEVHIEELNRTANDSLGGESLQRALARITGAEDTSWRGVMRRVAELAYRPTCRNVADYTKESFRCSECGCRVLVPGDMQEAACSA